ncbi:MAG: hypothetical protein N2512_13005 [Armatimonadetes bacterium]|nr:hypothetical protein [Armatimonadota bacterium]
MDCAWASSGTEGRFEGRFFRGVGDVEYLQLLDIARRMFSPDPEFQNLPMLYTPAWNGFVEGPTWGAWWIQNSYGPTYCALPFYDEPLITFLQNSHDLWFDQMGDGQRRGFHDWVAPDGCLCDAASPGWIVYKQGDGRIDIHDWGMEFTAAGLLMQAELLLISSDPKAIAHYLPRLERCANFIETRRDPRNNLFLAGPAGNLLAPSYAGWKRPDGTYGMAYLAGLSITYIAALDRLIELEKLAGNQTKAEYYAERCGLARKGLALLTTEEGYFVRSIDPDGTVHGIYGAKRHGYFEAPPNHDAICFRVVDDAQAEKIYRKVGSIPGLRPYDFILPNYPSYDDMYTDPVGLWEFGRWVNGGHWSTCEARMIMGYYRLGKYEDARRSMKRLLYFAKRFRMDNPLVNFGSDVYQPHEPINLTYDAFGPPAAMVRGLFEYIYRANSLTLYPHIPPSIRQIEQLFPIRFGASRLYLSAVGRGPVTGVTVNGRPWHRSDATSVTLAAQGLPKVVHICLCLGGAKPIAPSYKPGLAPAINPDIRDLDEYLQAAVATDDRAAPLANFLRRLSQAGEADSYEAAHALLAIEGLMTMHKRQRLQEEGKIAPLADLTSQAAADKSYSHTFDRLVDGLRRVMERYAQSDDNRRRSIAALWKEVQQR